MVRLLGDSGGKGDAKEKHISSFQAFAISIASRVGPEQVVYQIYYSHNVYVQLSICSKKTHTKQVLPSVVI